LISPPFGRGKVLMMNVRKMSQRKANQSYENKKMWEIGSKNFDGILTNE
jgi:hypothetical protein